MARPSATIAVAVSLTIAVTACAPPSAPPAAPRDFVYPPAAVVLPRAPTSADLARAGALRDKALRLFSEGDCEKGDGARTLALLDQSKAIAPSMKAAKRRLNCLLQLIYNDREAATNAASDAKRAEAAARLPGRYDDALTTIDELRVATSAELKPSDAKVISDSLAFLAWDGLVLDVSTNVAGLVVIDGHERGPVASRRAYWVHRGRHTLRVVRAGFTTFERVVEPKDGSLVEIVLHLDEVRPPEAPKAPTPKPARVLAPPPSDPLRLGAWAGYLRGGALRGAADRAPASSGCAALPRRSPSLAGLVVGGRGEVEVARSVSIEAGAAYLRAETWDERHDTCAARLETVHVLLQGAFVSAGASVRAPLLAGLSLLGRTSAGLWFTEATADRSAAPGVTRAALLGGSASPAAVIEPELGFEIGFRDLLIGATFGLLFVPGPSSRRVAGSPDAHGSFVMLSPQLTLSYAPR